MVKGAARNAGSSASSAPGSGSGGTRQPLPTMQTGQLPSDPLTLLNGPMGHGLMAGFNPFADMGLNTNDPNMVRLSL
jgi:ubiquilin